MGHSVEGEGMIETVAYKKHFYPKFQTEGNASQFAIPFALHVCKGYDHRWAQGGIPP